ncbi:MAG: peptidyl-prolyl cis-trans isomerase [Candidatus Hydrothermales bacterium]
MKFLVFFILLQFLKVEEAKKLIESGRVNDGIALYKEALLELSGAKKIERALDLIDVCIRYEKFREGLSIISELEEKVSKYSTLYPEVLYRKAIIHENLGNYLEAQKIYEKIVLKYKKSKIYEDASKKMDRIFEILSQSFIASVGPINITYQEFEKYLEALPIYLKPSPSDTIAVRKTLENLIISKILYLEALNQKLDLSEDFRVNIEREKERILANLYLKKINEEIKVNEKEIKEYYIRNREDFKIPTRWDIRRIEVKTESEAVEIIRKIKGGEKFEDLARKFSIAPDAQDGGFIPNFTEKSLPEEFVKYLKTMREGETKGPIKLKNGNYAIVKLEKIKRGEYRKLEEIKNQIENIILREKREKFWEKWKKGMFEKYSVKFYFKK